MITANEIAAVTKTRIDLGFAGAENLRPATLTLKHEDGVWQIDEIAAEGFPHGLRQALRETIAEDEALADRDAG